MTVIEKPKKAIFQHIEAEVSGYFNTKKEIQRLREEIMFSFGHNENVGTGKNSHRTPGKPTERIATRLIINKRLRNLESIVESIDGAFGQVSEDHQKVVRMRYWSGKRLTWEGVGQACHMHRNTAQKYRDEFVSLVAEKLGWR